MTERRRGRPSVPVGTIIPCSACDTPHAKQPKRSICPACIKAEVAFWSRMKYEERKAKDSAASQESMRASLDQFMARDWLSKPIRVSI